MMEAARTSETSVDNYFTRQYIPEDKSELYTRRRENWKSHTDNFLFLQAKNNERHDDDDCDDCILRFCASGLHHQGCLMMEALSISETSVNFYQITRHNIPEDSHI
jgi:hypothetical protein